MKLTFKLQAIRRIAGVIVLFAVIAFSFAACGDSGGDSINNDSDLLTKPSFKVETEIVTFEGSTLQFSPKQAPRNKWFDVPYNEFSKTHKITGYAEYILKNGLAATEVQH